MINSMKTTDYLVGYISEEIIQIFQTYNYTLRTLKNKKYLISETLLIGNVRWLKAYFYIWDERDVLYQYSECFIFFYKKYLVGGMHPLYSPLGMDSPLSRCGQFPSLVSKFVDVAKYAGLQVCTICNKHTIINNFWTNVFMFILFPKQTK